MKKSIIASLAVLASAAVVATFALAGAGKFGDVQVNADPEEYSVTFDAKSAIGVVGGDYVIGTKTVGGNKVGLVGYKSSNASLTFNGATFSDLRLFDYEKMVQGAYPFSAITGFAISFSGPFMIFNYGQTTIVPVESGKEYEGLSITPFDQPTFSAGMSVTITSLTIMYSC